MKLMRRIFGANLYNHIVVECNVLNPDFMLETHFLSNFWSLCQGFIIDWLTDCTFVPIWTKRIYLEVNNHERIRIRSLYIGKIIVTEHKLEINYASQTLLCNEPIESPFISFSTAQEKEWVWIIIQIFTVQRCCDYPGKLLTFNF